MGIEILNDFGTIMTLSKFYQYTLLIATASLTACSTVSPPTKETAVPVAPTAKPDNSPIVFTEPSVSAPFYALNPLDYTQPPEFEVNLYQAQTAPVNKLQVSAPASGDTAALNNTILDKNLMLVPTSNSNQKSLRFDVLPKDGELDVTAIDDFLNILEGKARHYPVRFTSIRERDGYTDRLKSIISTLDGAALRKDASYDVLLRAMKANTMARNMDLGEIYGPKALAYAKRLLTMNPQDPTVNFWLGFGLSEGGALKEAIPYLQAAMNGGVQEAHLSMANNYLYLEQNKNAITTLNNYKVKYPTEAAVVDQLVQGIQAGAVFNVWQTKK